MIARGRAPLALAACCAVVVASAAGPARAVTRWKELEPGKSGRAAVEAVLGAPVATLPPALQVYSPQKGTGRVVVDYGSGSAQRIEVELVKPLTRAALVKSFKLEAFHALKKPEPDGTLAEYFGAEASLVLFYSGKDEASGVKRIGFCSRDRFEQLTGPLAAQGGIPSEPATDALNPVDATMIIESLNPAACQDVYLWAQTQEAAAKKSRNAGRRQLLLDILISAQKGECDHARTQAAAYKAAYR